jgi:hypothetical protein
MIARFRPFCLPHAFATLVWRVYMASSSNPRTKSASSPLSLAYVAEGLHPCVLVSLDTLCSEPASFQCGKLTGMLTVCFLPVYAADCVPQRLHSSHAGMCLTDVVTRGGCSFVPGVDCAS